jgi:hypothetical protein
MKPKRRTQWNAGNGRAGGRALREAVRAAMAADPTATQVGIRERLGASKCAVAKHVAAIRREARKQ